MQVAPTVPCVDFIVAIHHLQSSQFSAGDPHLVDKSMVEKGDGPEKDRERLRILIVDDAPDVTEMLATFLQHAGFDTVMAFSGAEALEVARTEQLEMVISDIGMPGMNGYDLAIALRALPEYRNVPLIAVSGFSMYDDKDRALESGFDAHMVKPINPMSLLDLIKRLGG